MKVLSLKNGRVISVAMAYGQATVQVPEGGVLHEVDDGSNIQAGWTYTDSTLGGYLFSPPAALTTVEQDKASRIEKYDRRIDNAKKLIAEFAAENEIRVINGEWTGQQLQSVLADPKVTQLTILLSTGSYGTAVALVMSMTGGVYTDQLKAAWVAKIQAAM